MARDFQETDTENPCTDTVGCSGASTIANTPQGKEASSGGTAGTTAIEVKHASNTTGIVGVMFQLIGINATTWESGTIIPRLNITTAGTVLWTETHVCRFNSSCSNVETLGSSLLNTTSLSTTGVKFHTFSINAATSPAATDDMYIILVFDFDPGGHGNESFFFTPNQLIETPLAPPPVAPPGIVNMMGAMF